jgi:uncharacterized protein YjbJ (UPF0337 family)
MDSTRTKWEGRWDQLKGKAKRTWSELTDEDLDVAEGNYDEFVDRIKERTGESAEEIEGRLEEGSEHDSEARMDNEDSDLTEASSEARLGTEEEAEVPHR